MNKKDHTLADDYFTKGEKLYSIGKMEEAADLFEKASNIYEALDEWEQKLYTDYLKACCWNYLHKEGFQKLVEDNYQLAQDLLGKNHYIVGYYNYLMSLNAEKLGNYKVADEYVQIALSILKQNYGASSNKIIRIYNQIIKLSIHNNYDWIKLGFTEEKAFNILTEDGYQYFIDVVNTYEILAIYWLQNFLSTKAINLFKKALLFCQKYMPENYTLIISIYNSIANGFWQLQNFAEAKQYLENAITLAEKHQVERLVLFYTYIVLGDIYHVSFFREKISSDADKALQNYKEASTIADIFFLKDEATRSASYERLGNIYLTIQNYETAIKYFLLCLKVQKGNLNYLGRSSLKSLALVYIEQKNYAKALKYINRGIEEIKNITNPLVIIRARFYSLHIFAHIHLYKQIKEDAHHLSAAYHSVQLLNRVIEQLFLKTEIKEHERVSINFFLHIINERSLDTCFFLKEATQEKRYLLEAFTYLDRGKAYGLSFIINETKALKVAGLPTALIQKERNMRQGIIEYRKELHYNEHKKDDNVLKLRQKLLNQQEAYNVLIKELETNYPNYYKEKYQFHFADLY